MRGYAGPRLHSGSTCDVNVAEDLLYDQGTCVVNEHMQLHPMRDLHAYAPTYMKRRHAQSEMQIGNETRAIRKTQKIWARAHRMHAHALRHDAHTRAARHSPRKKKMIVPTATDGSDSRQAQRM